MFNVHATIFIFLLYMIHLTV